MQKRLTFLLKLTLFWCVLFIVARVLFECYNFANTSQLTLSEIFLTYIHGFRLDLSITSYFMAVYGLLVAFSVFVDKKYLIPIIKYLSYFLVFLVLFIVVVDVELFRNWGFRMDTTPLQYLSTPSAALASTPAWVTIIFIIFWLGLSLLACKLFLKFLSSDMDGFLKVKFYKFPLLLIFTALFALPARGTLSEWPIRISTVSFSNKQFANQASINVVWNFLHMATKKGGTKEMAQVIDSDTANKVFQRLQSKCDSTEILLNTTKPNVVIIILESFSSDAIKAFGGRDSITPCLDRLTHEGVSFPNFYATSYRSNVGLMAILAGYPAQYDEAILLFPNKSQNLPSLANNFLKDGYSTAFYYGGDSDFANLNSFIKSGGYDKLEDLFSFPKTLPHSSWGIHDHVMFDHLIHEIDSEKGPFFKVLYTLSSHEPFDVPGETRIKGDDENSRFMNTVAYTDCSLGNFIDTAKTKAWWKNTLFVLTADHSVRFIYNRPMELPRRYSIPMVWLGGALSKDHIQVSKIGSQQDIPATILSQMGKSTRDFKFSNNLLDRDTANGRAIYIWHQGFGLKTVNGAIAYGLNDNKVIHSEGDTTNLSVEAKSFFQVYVNDFNNKEFDRAQK